MLVGLYGLILILIFCNCKDSSEGISIPSLNIISSLALHFFKRYNLNHTDSWNMPHIYLLFQVRHHK